MKTFARPVLLGSALWAGALAPQAWSGEGEPPNDGEIRNLFEAYVGKPDAGKGGAEAKENVLRMGDEALPAWRRMFDETRDDARRTAIAEVLVSSHANRQAAAEFLMSRLPAHGADWSDRWETAALRGIFKIDDRQGRKLASLALQSPVAETRHFAVVILGAKGEVEDIPVLQGEMARQQAAGPEQPVLQPPITPEQAIHGIVFRAKRGPETPPTEADLKALLDRLAGTPHSGPGSDRDRALKLKRLRSAGLVLWRKLFEGTKDDARLVILTEAILTGSGDHRAEVLFLTIHLPEAVAEWDKKWVIAALDGVAANDPEQARQLALKALTAPAPAVRKAGVRILKKWGTQDDIDALRDPAAADSHGAGEQAIAAMKARLAALGDPPPGYAELKAMCASYADSPDESGTAEIRANWQKMGEEAQPALQRLFDETRNDGLLRAITTAMSYGALDPKAEFDFLTSRFPADVDAWGSEWVVQAMYAAPGVDPELARKLALKELTASDPEVRENGVRILEECGREEDIPALKGEIERQHRGLPGVPAEFVSVETTTAINHIRMRAETLRDWPPGCGRILWLISFQRSGGCPDGPAMERAAFQIRQMGEEAMPVWKYLLSRTSDREEMRLAVDGMVSGHADRQKVCEVLKSIIPADVGEWEKKSWVPPAIGGIASIDPELGRELALKELGCASAEARRWAANALAWCGREEDIPRLEEEAGRLQDSDPLRRTDLNWNAATNAIAKIKARLAPPRDPEEAYAEMKAAVEDYMRMPEEDDIPKGRARDRIYEMAQEAMPALQRLFAEKEDDAWRTFIVGLMGYSLRSKKEGFDFLESQLPPEVTDWKQSWVAEAIRASAAGGDYKLAHELGLKGLGSPSEAVRLAATELLSDLAYPENMAVFRKILRDQRGGDPFKPLDACGEAARKAVENIRRMAAGRGEGF